ncbi:Phosphatidylinositol transfer protein 3 [Linum grandiflorum]
MLSNYVDAHHQVLTPDKHQQHQHQHHKEDDAEKTKLGLLRHLAERHDPSSTEVEDATLRRFLKARDMDVEKASAMFLKYLKWRRSLSPISAADIPNEISQNKTFVQGSDKTGRPICVVFGARHFQNKIGGVEEFKPGQEKFVVIGDLEGWGYTNSDIRGYLAALHILQDYYPERLGKLFILHVPYVFMAVWKVVYPFIDCNTRKKIVFVENKKLTSTLLDDIDENQLPDVYGGKLRLVPIQET